MFIGRKVIVRSADMYSRDIYDDNYHRGNMLGIRREVGIDISDRVEFASIIRVYGCLNREIDQYNSADVVARVVRG